MRSAEASHAALREKPLSRPFADAKGHPPPQGGRTSALDERRRALANSSARAKVVAAARSWIGTPYRHQGQLKGVGCDCLGLLIGVWREVMGSEARLDETLTIPPYTPDWAEAMKRETFAQGLRDYLDEIDVAEAREGDIVLFRWRAHLPAKHAGILTARDRMVHAQDGAKVAEVALSPWWRRRMAFGFRVRPAAVL